LKRNEITLSRIPEHKWISAYQKVPNRLFSLTSPIQQVGDAPSPCQYANAAGNHVVNKLSTTSRIYFRIMSLTSWH